jgi:DNA polymerase II small subunit/DNA polymerase delta subunit B
MTKVFPITLNAFDNPELVDSQHANVTIVPLRSIDDICLRVTNSTPCSPESAKFPSFVACVDI